MSEIFGYVKPPLDELRDLLPGTDGFDFGTSRLSSAELPDLLPGGSADTGEAGTVSGQSGQPAPQGKAAGIHPPAKPLLTSTSPTSPKGAYGHAVGFKRKKPEAYTSPEVRSACRCIREAAAKQAREGGHYLRLNDREFLIVYAAVEHDRNRTRKAIRKGFAEPEDLKSTDSIWGVLQRVMVKRMKGYRL